ncbi:hypothetical protein Tco_0374651 [Tanacetum coccineum]
MSLTTDSSKISFTSLNCGIEKLGFRKKEVLGTLIFFTPWIISLKALTKLLYPQLSDVNDILLESVVELIGSVCQFNQVHVEPVHVNKRLLFGVYSIWIRSCLSVVMVVSRSWDCIAAMVEGTDTGDTMSQNVFLLYALLGDINKLEDAVSTISQEYLLEFTSEYGIPESLHPELPGPEEPIVEFSEGKVAVYTKFFEFANFHIDLFNLISAPNPTKVKTGTRPHAAHEVPLLIATASRVIDMEDTTVASESSGTPSALEKSPLDFANENPPSLITERDGAEDQGQDGLSREIPIENPTTTEVIIEPDLEKEVAAMVPLVNKMGNDKADANAPPKVLRKDHAAFRPAQSTLGEKSLASMGLEEVSTFYTPATQETPTDAKSVSDPDSLSYAKPQSHPKQDVAHHINKSYVHHNVNAGLAGKRPSRSPPKCCYHEGARPDVCGEPGVREISLLPVRVWVARRYLSARVGRDQQLSPGHPRRVPRHGRSHSTAGVLF